VRLLLCNAHFAEQKHRGELEQIRGNPLILFFYTSYARKTNRTTTSEKERDSLKSNTNNFPKKTRQAPNHSKGRK